MSISVLRSARRVFGVMAVTVFSALVLVGCGKDDDDGPSLDSKLVCANGEAWVTTDIDPALFANQGASRVGVILQENGNARYIDCWSSSTLGEQCYNTGKVTGSWSTNGNKITLTMSGEPFPGTPGTYTVSGNTAIITLNDRDRTQVTLTKESLVFL